MQLSSKNPTKNPYNPALFSKEFHEIQQKSRVFPQKNPA